MSQDTLLMIRALMRSLWQLYDSGGHSGRSLRARLLEGALWRVRQDSLPSIPDRTHETLQKIRITTPREGNTEVVSLNLEGLSLEMYTTLVICAIERLQDTENVSMTEEELVGCILHLLNAEERMKRYHIAGGKIFHDEELIAEGNRRLYLR